MDNNNWLYLGILIIVLGAIIFDDIQHTKKLNEYGKSVDSMTCSELENYIRYYSVIKVAKGQTAPFGFCEDLVDNKEREHCQIMEKEGWEYMSLEGIKLEYNKRCD